MEGNWGHPRFIPLISSSGNIPREKCTFSQFKGCTCVIKLHFLLPNLHVSAEGGRGIININYGCRYFTWIMAFVAQFIMHSPVVIYSSFVSLLINIPRLDFSVYQSSSGRIKGILQKVSKQGFQGKKLEECQGWVI